MALRGDICFDSKSGAKLTYCWCSQKVSSCFLYLYSFLHLYIVGTVEGWCPAGLMLCSMFLFMNHWFYKKVKTLFNFVFLHRTCVILLQETSSHCLLSLLLFLFLSSQTDFSKQNSPKKRFNENWFILLSKKLLDKMNLVQKEGAILKYIELVFL